MPNEKEIVNKEGLGVDALELPELKAMNVDVDVLRLDKIHPVISGNKWYKLKYFLAEARSRQCTTLISFGGAFSNHIIATACAAGMLQLKSVGIIRGETPRRLSHTLHQAKDYGMELIFSSRLEYPRYEKEKSEELLKQYPGSLIIPEGGAGPNGVKGSAEILDLTAGEFYKHVFCAVGTGTTFMGLSNAAQAGQTVIGIRVLKGYPVIPDGNKLLLSSSLQNDHHRIINDYHFGGYAKKNPELFQFMNSFYARTGIRTDFVYTGKLFYAALDLIQRKIFPDKSKMLIIHSGGLQGTNSLPKGTLNFN